MALDFYYSPMACSLASHIALEESGAAYTPHRVTIHDPGDPDGYRKINPKGTVPSLVVDGTLITENVAILTYVARAFPEGELLPARLVDQALVTSLLGWFGSTVHITFRRSFRPGMFARDEAAHASIVAFGREAFLANLEKLDELYRGKTWAVAEQFSIADCYALVFYAWGRRTELPMAQFAAYTAFKDRMLARPATRRVLEREDSPLLAAA